MNRTPEEWAARNAGMLQAAWSDLDRMRSVNADLLAALEEIVAEWSDGGCMAAHNDTAGIQWARDAIARAKGQSSVS